MIQKFTVATLIQHITDMEILEGMCLSALNNVRVDLPIQDLDYEPVFDRMRKDLPECDSRKMYIMMARHHVRSATSQKEYSKVG